jgi:CRISPR-associated endonuclease/helicase Cas3
MIFGDFKQMFEAATMTCQPFPYQIGFAEADQLPELLNAPTGAGKTATAILGWLWRRCFTMDKTIRERAPRRLVYCLPMRVLVEQTRNAAEAWLCNLGLKEKISVRLLMGGEDAEDWDSEPEREAILIGTQDMILSRALNRGYGMTRFRWPMHFGLLNNDCLWILDEVQLMGNGLATTAQLAAFGQKLWKRALPSHFLWMSATLGESFLDTRDRRDWGISRVSPGKRLELDKKDFDHPEFRTRWRAAKSIHVIDNPPKPSLLLDEHEKFAQGRLSLIVLNTVPTAMRAFSDLQKELQKPVRKKKGPLPQISLLHGRFRPVDREKQLALVEGFVSKVDKKTGAVPDNPGFVLVSTQVIEAGFDISAVRLWSEIAPWPSDVQRLGRLNREGTQPDAVAKYWMPKADRERENNKDSPNAKRIGPYDKPALQIGRKLLRAVVAEMESGTEYRDALDKVIQTPESRESLQVRPDSVIRPDDYHELFSTEPDLAGGFTNVSNFVRDADRNVDVQVFWREFPPVNAGRLTQSRPHRKELCPVPFFEFRRFLGNKGAAWEWNSEPNINQSRKKGVGSWERRRFTDVQPGMTLLLPRSAGGYSDLLGWTGSHEDKPTIFEITDDVSDGLNLDPDSSAEDWCLLSHHLADVEAEVCDLLCALGLENCAQGKAIATAARWHDWGKSLERWQNEVVRFVGKVRSQLEQIQRDPTLPHLRAAVEEWLPRWSPPSGALPQWAKFPNLNEVCNHSSLTKRESKHLRRLLSAAFSPGLRHEAASALAAWEAYWRGDEQLSALAVFLIASHHGKVRTVLRSTQDNDEVFGLSSENMLRPVPGFFDKSTPLHFDAKHVGAQGDWVESGSSFRMTCPSP